MTTQKISIEIKRVDGQTYLEFKVDKTLEDVFKKQSQEVRESQSWTGLKFYYMPDVTLATPYKNLLYRYNLLDDYGVSLFQGGKFNVAFLRTVGGEGTVKIKNDIPFAVVSDGMKNIIAFMKNYYEDFLKDYKVKGFVNFEV